MIGNLKLLKDLTKIIQINLSYRTINLPQNGGWLRKGRDIRQGISFINTAKGQSRVINILNKYSLNFYYLSGTLQHDQNRDVNKTKQNP